VAQSLTHSGKVAEIEEYSNCHWAAVPAAMLKQLQPAAIDRSTALSGSFHPRLDRMLVLCRAKVRMLLT